VWQYFHFHRRNHIQFSYVLLSVRPSWRSHSQNLLSVYRFPCSGHLMRMEPCDVVFKWLPLPVFNAYPRCKMHQYFLSHGGYVIFHCMHLPHFVYPFIRWLPFGLFLLFGYMKNSCTIFGWKCIFPSLVHTQRSGMVSNYMVSYLKNFQSIFNYSLTVLQLHFLSTYNSVWGYNFSPLGCV
jgi:hypothetical protein